MADYTDNSLHRVSMYSSCRLTWARSVSGNKNRSSMRVQGNTYFVAPYIWIRKKNCCCWTWPWCGLWNY